MNTPYALMALFGKGRAPYRDRSNHAHHDEWGGQAAGDSESDLRHQLLPSRCAMCTGTSAECFVQQNSPNLLQAMRPGCRRRRVGPVAPAAAQQVEHDLVSSSWCVQALTAAPR